MKENQGAESKLGEVQKIDGSSKRIDLVRAEESDGKAEGVLVLTRDLAPLEGRSWVAGAGRKGMEGDEGACVRCLCSPPYSSPDRKSVV